MVDVSVIIPARDEVYLQNTVDDIYKNARTDFEVIVVLDGYWPEVSLKPYKNLVIIHRGKPHGMRSSINTGAFVAKGKYLLKCDAHCSFAEGFDKQLVEDSKEDNWVLVPTRYSLNTSTWDRKINKKYEFQYISSDDLKGKTWHAYGKRVPADEKLIDLMTTQGSCWFMSRKWWDHIGGEDEVNYGIMGREAQEICLKTWLGGGRFVLTRNTWYAHWSKSKHDPRYAKRDEKQKSVDFARDFWLNDKWDKAVRPLSWLIEKFDPVPTWDLKKEVIVSLDERIKSNYTLDFKLGENRPIVKGLTRSGLYKLFDSLDFKVGCEVGVQRARNSWVMFQSMPKLEKLYLVEPYADHPSNPRKWKKSVHDRFKAQAHKRMKNYPVEWIEGFSEEVSGQVKDNSLDFVYIDAEHFYDYVMLDLILWNRKVKKGGIIAGHDYVYWKPYQFKVFKAVEDFVKAYNYPMVYITDKETVEYAGDSAPSFFFVKSGEDLRR